MEDGGGDELGVLASDVRLQEVPSAGRVAAPAAGDGLVIVDQVCGYLVAPGSPACVTDQHNAHAQKYTSGKGVCQI